MSVRCIVNHTFVYEIGKSCRSDRCSTPGDHVHTHTRKNTVVCFILIVFVLQMSIVHRIVHIHVYEWKYIYLYIHTSILIRTHTHEWSYTWFYIYTSILIHTHTHNTRKWGGFLYIKELENNNSKVRNYVLVRVERFDLWIYVYDWGRNAYIPTKFTLQTCYCAVRSGFSSDRISCTVIFVGSIVRLEFDCFDNIPKKKGELSSLWQTEILVDRTIIIN